MSDFEERPDFMPFSKPDGTPYRPSNGTEGEYFRRKMCHACHYWHDTGRVMGCEYEIHVRAMAFDLRDDDYPEEWQWQDGDPVCTKFEHNDTTP